MVAGGELKRSVQNPLTRVILLHGIGNLDALQLRNRLGQIKRRRETILFLGIRLLVLITQAEIQREVPGNLPVIVDISTEEPRRVDGSNQAGMEVSLLSQPLEAAPIGTTAPSKNEAYGFPATAGSGSHKWSS